MIALKGRVHTITNGILENGVVLIEDGKIKEVGENLEIPKNATIYEAEENGYITPGFIDCHSHLAMFGEPSSRPSLWADGNEISHPIVPNLSVRDAIYPQDKGINHVRDAGFTTLFILPGSSNLNGGMGLACKLRGQTVEEMIIPGTEQMKFAFGENPKFRHGEMAKRAPYTRMSAAAQLREFFDKALEYGEKKKRAKENETPEKAPEYNAKYEAILPVLRGEMKARLHAHRADDINTAIRLCEEYNLDYSLEHVTEGRFIKEKLADKNPNLVLGPFTMAQRKSEVWNASLDTAGILAKEGCTNISLMMDTGIDTRHLPTIVGWLIRQGFPEQDAFEAITIRPAKNIGLEDRMGSIEVGKDADIAIFNGHPFDNFTTCTHTFIDGVLFDKQERTF